jgi:hypothetical protein
MISLSATPYVLLFLLKLRWCTHSANQPNEDMVFLPVRGGTSVAELRTLIAARTDLGVERQVNPCLASLSFLVLWQQFR